VGRSVLRSFCAVAALWVAGCGPPFPGGEVVSGPWTLPLGTVEGATEVPSSPTEAAHWAARWQKRTGDPRRPWALARLELLREHPVPSVVERYLDQSEGLAGHECAMAVDRLAARALDGRLALAIAEPGCAESDP